MKKQLSILLFTCLMSPFAGAQSEVHFQINHKLGSSTYSPNQSASNNLGDPFKIQRLDYYISEITLYHDGGQVTDITDHYILVKAARDGMLTSDVLGNYTISQLDSVRFGIGVDGSKNHSDISAYASNHPLSFQSPSMHWGWSAGYRFVAIEGMGGASMNQGWQLHGLGDANYGYATVVSSGTWDGSKLIIAIDADYEMALKDITVNGSLNYHGSSSHAVSLLNNFKNEVFSAGAANVSLEETESVNWALYPNPSSSEFAVSLSQADEADQVEIRDLSGKLIETQSFNYQNELNLELNLPGVYLISLIKDNAVIASQKLIIQ